MVVTGFAMAAIGIALAAVVVVLKRAELLSGLILLALSLLGGAFFPIDVLPDWIQPVAELLPTAFAFSGTAPLSTRAKTGNYRPSNWWCSRSWLSPSPSPSSASRSTTLDGADRCPRRERCLPPGPVCLPE